MARLSAGQWEKARAEYEVRGISLGEIARRLNVNVSSVSRKAKAEGWKQGQMQDIVERKVAAVKALAEVETQTQDLPLHFQHTIETVARERLQAEGMLAGLDVAISARAIELAGKATRAEDLEILSRARKNLTPQLPKEGTTVNISQQQAGCIQAPSPRDALAELVRNATETPLGEGDADASDS